MKYYTLQPVEELKAWVSHFWVSELDGSTENSFTYISTADSCPKLVFPYRIYPCPSASADREFFSSALQGQTQTHFQVSTLPSFGIFGVYLFPYAIPYLFSMPASELSDEMVDLNTLLGQAGKDLNEKMATACDHAQRIRIMTEFFINQLSRNSLRETAVISAIRHIRKEKGLVNIKALSAQYCLSQKQFERKFKAFSGFMPKLYARIARFEAVLNGYSKGQSLTETGYACGYYDQAHFVHDFRKFSGFSPKNYFSSIPELP